MERMPEVQLDRRSDTPLFRQIADSIRREIQTGVLAGGVKLPASRVLAKRLGVHRRTVVAAFAALCQQGWLSSGVGQGTFVREREAGAAGEATGESSVPLRAFSWDLAIQRRPPDVPDPWKYWPPGPEPERTIHFMGATADPSLFPTEDFRLCLEQVFRDLGASALEYGPPEGFGPLREWVSESLRARGVRVDPDGILIVSGSQQGLDLVSRLLVRDGETVLVEEPGYANGYRLFQANGARAIGVPVDGDGLRLDHLEALAGRHSARLLYTMPVFQNPTGVCLAADRQAPLLEICARRSLPIVEDHFDADLYYDGAPPRPLKAIDERDQVILLGSFSKILFPGLRLGWLAAPRALRAPLLELKRTADFSTGLLVQCAINFFCRQGRLGQHLERVRRIYGKRLREMLESMERDFPPGTNWTRPRGGLTLWVTLPPGADAWELLQSARGEGVDFSPGTLFHAGGGGREHFRLSWIRETEERIRRGVAVLGSLAGRLTARTEPVSASGPFF